jgi:bisphosphoglycerate-dependent phosphoglycerate mutase
MSICKDDYISAEEIAEVTVRKVSYLKNEIIPKMIAEDIAVRYPHFRASASVALQ